MSFFSAIGNAFKSLGKLIVKGLQSAQGRGLTDAVVALAVEYVRAASTKFTDNAARREFVVQVLVAKKIPESIARLAVELAVQLVKNEVAKLPQ